MRVANLLVALSLVAICASPVPAEPGNAKLPVKVFILAGQSNMEGKAKLSLLEYQVKQPGTRELFQNYEKDGQWTEREDVWIKCLDRHGNLKAGYGSLNCIGPELEFGHVVGNYYDQQVLLIKTAWGGRSLQRDFRSPSAGFPPQAVLDQMLANAKKRAADPKKPAPEPTMDDIKAPFGASYREMLKEVEATLANLKTLFPAYQGQGFELAGFIWFQGWNDMINAEATAEYTSNLGHLIRDVRKDFKSPRLPAVIGQMGVDGPSPSQNVQKFKEAQAAIEGVEEFRGNVAVVKTDVFWDTEAAAVFKRGWRENLDEWNRVGSDFPFHYLGSAKTLCGIGGALGKAAVELDSPAK